MTHKTSAAGRAALLAREGCRLSAYQDGVGIWTIGAGHTGRASPPAVKPGMTITRAEADEIFARDLEPFEAAVNQAAIVAMTQAQFDAMVSLAFNIGVKGFAGSTVVRKLNAGDLSGAADAFMLWDRPPELRSRREAERRQFLSDGPAPGAPPVTLRPTPPKSPPPSTLPAAPPKLGWLSRLWIALTFRKAA